MLGFILSVVGLGIFFAIVSNIIPAFCWAESVQENDKVGFIFFSILLSIIIAISFFLAYTIILGWWA